MRAALFDPEAAVLEKPPRGMRCYETVILIRPDATEEERESELQMFEAMLKEGGAEDVSMQDRGEQPLAYPIQDYIAACYVVYTFTSPPAAAKAAQLKLVEPIVGSVKAVLRQMTFCLRK